MNESKTEQMKTWAGNFGKEYTDRNALSLQELDLLYRGYFGMTRTEMNQDFVAGFNKDMKILEVGSNIGNQLLLLQQMGFKNLYGIELQPYAVELSKSRTTGINIIYGSAFDIPFRDCFFDMVFTSGLLIHIAPEDIAAVLDEIYRCTKKYIWGMEYFAKTYTQIEYREHSDLLWKTNFPKLFLDRFANIKLVKKKFFKYLNDDNVDIMFLLLKSRSTLPRQE
jgi:pseudaminic acid biosynthesis-associated methylase